MCPWIDHFNDLHRLCHGAGGLGVGQRRVQGENPRPARPVRVLSDTGGVQNSDGAGSGVRPRSGSDHEADVGAVGILGTTISPYLFFWQAAQE